MLARNAHAFVTHEFRNQFHRVSSIHELTDYRVAECVCMHFDICYVSLESDCLQAFVQTWHRLGEVTEVEDVAFIEVRRERAFGTQEIVIALYGLFHFEARDELPMGLRLLGHSTAVSSEVV